MGHCNHRGSIHAYHYIGYVSLVHINIGFKVVVEFCGGSIHEPSDGFTRTHLGVRYARQRNLRVNQNRRRLLTAHGLKELARVALEGGMRDSDPS